VYARNNLYFDPITAASLFEAQQKRVYYLATSGSAVSFSWD